MTMQLLVSLFFIAVLLVLTLIVTEAAWQNRRLVLLAQEMSCKVAAATGAKAPFAASAEARPAGGEARVAAIESATRVRREPEQSKVGTLVTNLGPITIEADGSLAIPAFDLKFQGFEFEPVPPPPASPAVPEGVKNDPSV